MQARTNAIAGRSLSSGSLHTKPASIAPHVLDLNQVAELLDAHPKTVRLMAQAGKIPGFRVGRLWRFSAARIYEWIEQTTYSAAA